jgi:hypothetical protein
MVFSASLLLFSMSTLQREFRFVPYGTSFTPANDEEAQRPTVSCDGRIPGGVTLELTHWTGNETPDNLYADTSTDMAIRFAQQRDRYPELENALILNNHFDTDGVLSVWACLEPSQASQTYNNLLKEGAEAGDFGEWSSDLGVKLDCAVSSFLEETGDEKQAYINVLKELPSLLRDLQQTGGVAYERLWKDDFEEAIKDWKALQEGSASLQRGPSKMVILKSQRSLSPYALHRGLRESGLWSGTTRILHVVSDGASFFRYRYEMPGHGWVKKLVDRHVVPSVDGSQLAKQLPDGWAASGGLVGICHSTRALATPPEEVASMLHRLDSGCL